jgi:hypothetical protein
MPTQTDANQTFQERGGGARISFSRMFDASPDRLQLRRANAAYGAKKEKRSV